MLVDDGIILRKYWFSVSDVEQERRFRSRAKDPMRQWKLSPMDLESITRWEDYSEAKDIMMAATSTEWAPWHVVESEDKRRSRVNVMHHLLTSIPHEPMVAHGAAHPEASGSARLRAPARRTGRTTCPTTPPTCSDSPRVSRS